jgi:Outer membrane protein beta-barrel domain
MKKITGILVLLFAATAINAQLSIGILGGVNFSKFKQDIDYSGTYFVRSDVRDLKMKTCFVIGIPLEIRFSEKFAAYTEFKYQQKGMRAYTEDSYIDEKTTIDGSTTINYLELPLQVKYYVTSGKMKTYVMFGPSFGYAIKGHSKYTIDTDYIDEADTHEVVEEDLKSDEFEDGGINRFDISLTLGAGLSYKAGPGSVFFNACYYYGFIDMTNDNKLDINGDVTQYHRGVTAVFGYMIEL